MTLRLITEVRVRPHLKSTRHLYSRPSLSKTGSIVRSAGRTDRLKKARSVRISCVRCLAFSRLWRISTVYMGSILTSLLYQRTNVIESSSDGGVILQGRLTLSPTNVWISGKSVTTEKETVRTLIKESYRWI